MSHRNARLNVHGRQLLVARVREQGWAIAHAAKAMGISRQCAHRWVAGSTPIAAYTSRLPTCPSRILTMIASTNTAAYTASSGRDDHACISSMTRSVIRLTVSFDTLAPVDLPEVRADLPGRQTLRIQRQHNLVDITDTPLTLLDDDRHERAVTVARHL